MNKFISWVLVLASLYFIDEVKAAPTTVTGGVTVANCTDGFTGAAIAAGNPLAFAVDGNGHLCLTVVGGTIAATQSGTWTVQPGNTANTTPWLMTVAQGGNSATVSAGGSLKVDQSKLRSVHGRITVPTTAVTYTANQSLGGLLTIPVFESTVNKSGTLARVSIQFKGASQTPSLKVYVWEQLPDQSGTPTCANAATFNHKSSSKGYLVDIYSLVPTTSTSTTMTDAVVKVADPVVNRDVSPTTNIYACVVTETSVTTAANDAELILRVVQD